MNNDHVLQNIKVTSGEIDLGITDPSFRAVINKWPGYRLAVSFVYEGKTAEARPLKSGQIREQVGIKLRARDGDNVVYAMWRWSDGGPRLWATTKIGGTYREPTWVLPLEPVPAPTPGERYVLKAHLDNRVLRIWWQNKISWVGEILLEALTFDGPPGLRTDNAKISAIIMSNM